LKTDADVWKLADEVAAARPNELKELQQCYGINFHKEALLFDVELRDYVKPASSNRFDVMHILFSNGCVGKEIAYFLHAAKAAHGVYFKELREYMKEWNYPSAWFTPPAQCFSEARENSCNELLKASATELLSVYPALRQFIVEAFSESQDLTLQFDSILKLFRVCDLVKQGMRCDGTACVEKLAKDMEVAITDYLEAFKLAYGAECMIFKHHLLMHVPDQLRRDLLLLSCWCLERKHLVALQSLQNYHHHKHMGMGALSRMQNAQVLIMHGP